MSTFSTIWQEESRNDFREVRFGQQEVAGRGCGSRDRWLSEEESDKQHTFLNIKAISGILRVTRAQEIAKRPKSCRVGLRLLL